MTTVQLPFFLNSGRGANRSATGHAFEVKLDPPAKIPPNAKNTRIFVQSASCVYSFPNVSASNNKIRLYYQAAGPPWSNAIGFNLEVTPGLYASLDELQIGIAEAAIRAGVHKNNPSVPVSTVSDFTDHYFEIRENTVLSRVELVIKDQHLQVTLDRSADSQDLFTKVLGFDVSQVLHNPPGEYQVSIEEDETQSIHVAGDGVFNLEWRRNGQTWTDARANDQAMLLYIPARSYTAKTLQAQLNAAIVTDQYNRMSADDVTSIFLSDMSASPTTNAQGEDVVTVTVGFQATVASGNAIEAIRFPDVAASDGDAAIALQAGANPVLPTDEITFPRDLETNAWIYPDTTVGETIVTASGAASIDNIHALQIAAPGLAAGVHVNGKAGTASLCRFPINTGPGEVIQFEPINPIRNSYDMSGFLLSQFRVELLDQHGSPVDTAGEEYNTTLVIEYEV